MLLSRWFIFNISFDLVTPYKCTHIDNTFYRRRIYSFILFFALYKFCAVVVSNFQDRVRCQRPIQTHTTLKSFQFHETNSTQNATLKNKD